MCQLELVELFAAESAAQTNQESRYHFNYAHLQHNPTWMKHGIADSHASLMMELNSPVTSRKPIMSELSAVQCTAFATNGRISVDQLANLLISGVFVMILLWEYWQCAAPITIGLTDYSLPAKVLWTVFVLLCCV